LELGLRFSGDFQRTNALDVDAHRNDGKRFVVRANEKLTAFLELESAILWHKRPFGTRRQNISAETCDNQRANSAC
jgi:hypothetical protein